MKDKHIELFIPGTLKDESVICNIIKKFSIDLRIVEASFSTESGWAYLTVGGDDQEIKKVFDYLKALGVSVEVRD